VVEPRVSTIEGRRVLVVERRPPLPPTLSLLLEGGRDRDGRVWRPMRTVARVPLRLSGTTTACLGEDHRLASWLDGYFTDRKGILRTLRLMACLDCGGVQVRDVSLDTMAGLDHGRLPLRRRDHILGWYSGVRPRQRLYGRAT